MGSVHRSAISPDESRLIPNAFNPSDRTTENWAFLRFDWHRLLARALVAASLNTTLPPQKFIHLDSALRDPQ